MTNLFSFLDSLGKIHWDANVATILGELTGVAEKHNAAILELQAEVKKLKKANQDLVASVARKAPR